MSETTSRTCKICGKPLTGKRMVYCSDVCAKKGHSITVMQSFRRINKTTRGSGRPRLSDGPRLTNAEASKAWREKQIAENPEAYCDKVRKYCAKYEASLSPEKRKARNKARYAVALSKAEKFRSVIPKYDSIIYQLRTRAGMTQKELADRIGVAPNSIGNWENGISVPSPQYVEKLSDVFGVPVDMDSQRESITVSLEKTLLQSLKATAQAKNVTLSEAIEAIIVRDSQRESKT